MELLSTLTKKTRLENRHNRLLGYARIPQLRAGALSTLSGRVPVFVYFNSYTRVRPNIHLERFAQRVEQNLLDDARYDYGNLCLLKLLGFTPRELATLAMPLIPAMTPKPSSSIALSSTNG